MGEGNFGEFLRNERLARNVTLEQVEARSKIALPLLEGLERNDFTRWPRERFYKEHFLRGYASALGLDPQLVVQRFRREFPVAEAVESRSASRSPSGWWRLAIPAFAIAALITALIVIAAMDRQSAASPGNADTAAATQSTDPLSPIASPAASAAPSAGPLLPAKAPAPANVGPLDQGETIEGELVIASDPPGARVTVNGIARGNTPLRVQFLPIGTYTIRFIKDGYVITERRASLTPQRPRARVSSTLRLRELE